MKIIVVHRQKLKNILAAMLIIFASVIYTIGMNSSALDVFKNKSRELPVYCVDTEEKKVAISFDAAWGANYTEDLLAILKKYNVKSTFFLVGFWVDKYPDMVKRISEDGHEVQNHSSSHPKMTTLSEEKIKEELESTNKRIELITGKRTTLFRPPFGDYSNKVINSSRELGYQVIQWDVDSLDYKDYGANSIIKIVTSKVKNGSIVLFHNNATYTKEALPVIIENLQSRGYEIVPISELIYKENYFIDHTGKQKELK